MKILVVAAHPDDEVLGAGATMARHVAKGDSVAVLILGEGVTSRYDQRNQAPASKLNALKMQSRKALEALGISKVYFSDFPDNRFDSCDLLDLVKAVEKVKREIRPEIIYTHHRGDLNIDHRLAFEAVITATRPIKSETVKKILSFEVLSSTEWNFSCSSQSFVPNVFVDVSKFLAKKLKAFKIYRSEVRSSYHPRSLEGIRTLSRWRGLQVGTQAAETFVLVREIL